VHDGLDVREGMGSTSGGFDIESGSHCSHPEVPMPLKLRLAYSFALFLLATGLLG
jgi:hypothetical protein